MASSSSAVANEIGSTVQAVVEANRKKKKVKKGKDFFSEQTTRTISKHGILRMVSQAFAPIMANQRAVKTILIVDGFAGPGMYGDDKDGSPVLTCKTLLEHSSFKKNPALLQKFRFVAIEADKSRVTKLKNNLEQFKEQLQIEVIHGEFKDKILGVLDKYEADASFVFVDPFGYSGMPMQILQTILTYPKTDILVNFMDGSIRRWRSVSKQTDRINELMGTTAWQTFARDSDFLEKLVNLFQLMLQGSPNSPGLDLDTAMEDETPDADQQLANVITQRYQMKNKLNSHIYHLVYATRHEKGLQIANAAMHKYSGLPNDFVFSERHPQTNGSKQPQEKKETRLLNAKEVAVKIREHYKGKSCVTGFGIQRFINRRLDDGRAYHFNFKNQLKKELAPNLSMVDLPYNGGMKFTKLRYSFEVDTNDEEVQEVISNMMDQVCMVEELEPQAPLENMEQEVPAPPVLPVPSSSVPANRRRAEGENDATPRPKKFKKFRPPPNPNRRPIAKGIVIDSAKQPTLNSYFKKKQD